jgi:hypothetical protein
MAFSRKLARAVGFLERLSFLGSPDLTLKPISVY